MGISDSKSSTKWLAPVTNLVLLLATTAIIVWALPRSSGLRFNYEVNKPWTYDALIADFTFYVFKSDEAIKEEKHELLKDFYPYVELDASVEAKALEEFEKAVGNDTTGILDEYSTQIKRRLHSLYEKGIIDDHSFNALSSDSTYRNICIVVDHEPTTVVEVNDILKRSEAYKRMFYDDDLSVHLGQLVDMHLDNFILPNLTYDEQTNKSRENDLLSSVATTSGQVEKNEKIIGRGEIVDEATTLKISSLEKEFEKRNSGKNDITGRLAGQTIFVLMFVSLFTFYLTIFRRKYYSKPLNILMLYALITVFPVAVSLMMQRMILSIYILPFAIVPMITSAFLDSRTAFMTHATTVLISAVAVNYQYEFIIIEMASGLAAIYALSDMSKRAHLFKAALMATLCAAAVYYAMQLIINDEIQPKDRSMFVYLAISGVLLLLAYPLMYVIEKLFGFTSNITFFELSDTNQELLRMLSEKAPGTFAHSTTVGNLASEVAKRIGANILLVRTGALYHDIGKMVNPVFFTENQAGVNPHDKLSEKGLEKESARIITSHVTEGLKLAEKYDLPDVITDFIRTHHGKGMAKFFYIQYKNKHPEEEPDANAFAYPGPNPQTREQAILMMTDTVEAATKSLKVYDDESISKKVNELIDAQVKEGFFEECPITFRDIADAKQVLIERLKSLYHTRITYPKDNSQKQED